jgi:peptide/nickel transport system substrate-binding protein
MHYDDYPAPWKLPCQQSTEGSLLLSKIRLTRSQLREIVITNKNTFCVHQNKGNSMKTIAKAAFVAGLLLGTSVSAFAVERGGTLNYGRYADSLFLEPVLNDANVDIWVLSNLYDTLLLPTDDGKGVQPGLATAWKLSDDGLSVELTLRDGIKFSDGTPITPADVAWSLKRAAKPDNGE